MSEASVYPSWQPHTNEPLVLPHSWTHLLVPMWHSSISADRYKVNWFYQSRKHKIPSQFRPSDKLYPESQSHSYEPLVLTQSCSQSFIRRPHSSISTVHWQNIKKLFAVNINKSTAIHVHIYKSLCTSCLVESVLHPTDTTPFYWLDINVMCNELHTCTYDFIL